MIDKNTFLKILNETFTVADLDAGAKELWRACINVLHKAHLTENTDDKFRLHRYNLQTQVASLDEARQKFYQFPEDQQVEILWNEYCATHKELLEFLGKYNKEK